VLACPRFASADWLLAGYIGAAKTPATTLHVTPTAGTAFDLSKVAFAGKAFKTPPYYGYRIAQIRKDSRIGFEAEFIHAKTIAVDTKSAVLTAFEQSHGLNFVLGNVAYRPVAWCDGRCTVAIRGGGGITLPHVEATYLGEHAESYQFGGPAAQAGAGLELAIASGFTAIADGRVTIAHVSDDLPGAVLSATFVSWHLSAGVGWKFK
jgi:lipid A oxidase